MPKVLYYNAKAESKIDSPRRLLSNIIFPNTGFDVKEVTAENFCEELDDNTAILLIPGARAGTTYRNQLRGANFQHLREKIKNGLWVLSICAGSYVLANEFLFIAAVAEDKAAQGKYMVSELGMANLLAFGPDPRLYPQKVREEGNPWSVYTAAGVEFSSSQGGKMRTSLALSQGPSFVDIDPNYEVLARYEKTADAAIVKMPYGKGGIILSGPALEVGGKNLMHYVHPDHYENPHTRDIVHALESSRESWAELLATIFDKMLVPYPQAQRQIRKNLSAAIHVPEVA